MRPAAALLASRVRVAAVVWALPHPTTLLPPCSCCVDRFWNESFVYGGAAVGPPLLPFGHGLSYTTWAYANLTVSPASSPAAPLPACTSLRISATVCNTGGVDSDEVSQACEWVRGGGKTATRGYASGLRA